MKIKDYLFIAALSILGVLFMQQCSKNKNIVKELENSITVLSNENKQLIEHNNLNKEKYYKIKAQLDSCINSPAKEKVSIRYIHTVDTVYSDIEFDTISKIRPKRELEIVETYHSDSTYKVTSAIDYEGKLYNFSNLLEFNKNPYLPTNTPDFIEYTPKVILNNPTVNIRKPRLFITSGLEFIDTPRKTFIDYNAGVTILDNANRIFQVRKSLTCATCGSFDFGVPLIYSK